MSVAIVTGAAGLIGSETCKFVHEQGMDVVGVDNDLRSYFFGPGSSTAWQRKRLESSLTRYRHLDADIRDASAIDKAFKELGENVTLVVHTAAQPSHDWAAREPVTDFTVNANGTLVMLEAVRKYCPNAVFIFTSTNKVYGDLPNELPLIEQATRWELEETHPFAKHGIDETVSIDQSKHSVFGASKVAADVITQEYGRYFGLRTGTFRGGCLTGPAHSGAELHGFLAYLSLCAVTGKPYTIFGYKGKQVRDNIHSADLVSAFWQFYRSPRQGAVYNIGGSRHANCSVLEAISMIEELSGKRVQYTLSPDARSGDHIWYVSDVRRFQRDYPNWAYQHDLRSTLSEILDATKERLRMQ